MPEILTNVAGVTFQNDDGTDRQEILSRMSKGRKIRLRDASSEEYPEAISVHNVKGEQLGNLPKDVAEYIRRKSIAIETISAEVDRIEHPHAKPWYCTIKMIHSDFMQHAVGKKPFERKNDDIDWEDLRDTLGIYDRAVTRYDVDRYLAVRESRAERPTYRAPTPEQHREREERGPGVFIAVCVIVVLLFIWILSSK